MSDGILLAAESVEAIARRVAELLGRERPRTFALLDAAELAGHLGVSTDYVYEHAVELGAMRLGSGPRARIRFDLDTARQALEQRRRRPRGRPPKRAA